MEKGQLKTGGYVEALQKIYVDPGHRIRSGGGKAGDGRWLLRLLAILLRLLTKQAANSTTSPLRPNTQRIHLEGEDLSSSQSCSQSTSLSPTPFNGQSALRSRLNEL